MFLGLRTVDSIADVSEILAVSIVKVEISMVDQLITFPCTLSSLALDRGIKPLPFILQTSFYFG
jgi:hypothetical protein